MKAAGKTLSALTGPLPIAAMYGIPGIVLILFLKNAFFH